MRVSIHACKYNINLSIYICLDAWTCICMYVYLDTYSHVYIHGYICHSPLLNC